MCVFIILFMAFALHLIYSLAYMELHCRLLPATVPLEHRLLGMMMWLHTLFAMKTGEMSFALHMHYVVGL